jgi:hypothetical protein
MYNLIGRDGLAAFSDYSTENQCEASIEDQVRLCTARSAAEGWTVVCTYADHALNGANHLRPGYQQLLSDARAGAFVTTLTARSVATKILELDRPHRRSPFSRSTENPLGGQPASHSGPAAVV